MKIVLLIISILIFIKTFSYGIFEIKNNNKSGGFIVILVSIISLIFPDMMIFIRGI